MPLSAHLMPSPTNLLNPSAKLTNPATDLMPLAPYHMDHKPKALNPGLELMVFAPKLLNPLPDLLYFAAKRKNPAPNLIMYRPKPLNLGAEFMNSGVKFMYAVAKLMNSKPLQGTYPAIRVPSPTTGTGNGGACYAIGSSQPAAAAAERGTASNPEHESPAGKGIQRIAPQ